MTPDEVTRAVDGLLDARSKATQGEWQVHLSHIYGPEPDRVLIGQFRNDVVFNRDFIALAANTIVPICERFKELERNYAKASKAMHDYCAVFAQLFGPDGKYQRFGEIGDLYVELVPRLIDKLEAENAELRARLEEKQ